jgi:hypothetical protein
MQMVKLVEANVGCNLAAPAGLWHIRRAAEATGRPASALAGGGQLLP